MALFDDAGVGVVKEVAAAADACPWCGDEGSVKVVTHLEGRVTHRVVCEKCMASGPVSTMGKITAVHLWNSAGKHWKPISTLTPEYDEENVLLLHTSGRITFGPGSYGRTVSALASTRLNGKPVDGAFMWMPVPKK